MPAWFSSLERYATSGERWCGAGGGGGNAEHGIKTALVNVDVIKNVLGTSFGRLAPEPSAVYQRLE